MKAMQKITPFLWFDNNIEEAIDFYTGIFKNFKVNSLNRLQGMGDKVFSATFELEGQNFMALNGGPQFKFTEAISFYVNCETQQEIDYYWEKLSNGGSKSMCGWLKDPFGLSWQIVPANLGELLYNKDPEKAKKVMDALMKMNKLDIAALEQAAA
jgi:predicted 3-demethylubiquinone-9 3-methyltransferase (glyoxalase superfamily)